MPVISVRFLGPPELRIDGEPPPPPMRWRKHFGLCLLLWADTTRRISRDRALDMFWGDRDERVARHSLNEALRVIRKAVGAEALDASGDMIHWLAPVSVDLEQFAAHEHSDPVAAAALIHGAWCEGFAIPDAPEFERWLDDERRTWRARQVAVLTAAAQYEADRGNPMAALRWSAQSRRLDPLSEIAARAMIRAHALNGDRTAAMAEGADFTKRLHSELGATVSLETSQLLKRLAERRTPDAERPRDSRRSALPFVASGPLLERLLTGLREAQARSTPALMLLDGAPGSGRTRLLEELQLRAGLEGMTVLTVRAVPADRTAPGAGLRAIAGSGLAVAAGASAVAPAALDALIEVSPAWAEQFAPPHTGHPVALHEALIAALRVICAERPVCLGLDDVDWLDDLTLQQLPDLMRGVTGLPLVVMATVQAGETRTELDNLRRYVDRPDRGVLARLEPMSEAAIHELVVAALPAWDLDAHARLTRRLWAESAGTAAVVVGVLEAVIRGLALDETISPWPTPDRTLDATLPARLPDALTASTRMRFHLLDTQSRDLLSILAVRGEPMPSTVLAPLVGMADGELDRRLDALEWEHWLVADARGYRFRARAVGTLVATEMLTPGQRQRLQLRLGAN